MKDGWALRQTVLLLLILTGAALSLRAHVGSPDVYYEGEAGPYHVFVTVKVPLVIPGVAEIQIRCAANDARTVQIVPMRLSGAGSNYPPTPDLAQQSKDDPQFFTGSLWLMESGALKVRVTVDGTKGKGEVSVPVPAAAQKVLTMDRPLGGLLTVLMLFLALGMVFIAGASVREGNLGPGETPSPARVMRARIVMAITAAVVLGILYLGRAWWGAEAHSYQRNVNGFKPPAAITELQNGNRLVIHAKGQDAKEVKMDEVIPDHGHLMHLFLVSAPGLDKMWHLHPERIAGGGFAEDLPEMPAGRYEIFADVVDKAGFPWTLVGSVDLPQISGKDLSGDDAAWPGGAVPDSSAGDPTANLGDGGKMVWEHPVGALKSRVATNFKFRVDDKDGKPVKDLQPYMGMAGHAEFVSKDLSVFAHVHPAGSAAMAALELAQAGPASIPGGLQLTTPMKMPMQMTAASLPAEVSFPYGFPQPGDYRIFVQVNRAGAIETGVFDAHVE